jgi:hypothetical protein
MKAIIQIVDDAGNAYAGEIVLQKIRLNGEISAKSTATSSKAGRISTTKITCPAAIERLWKKGKFQQPLAYPDVKKGLSGEGFNFPRTTVMMALARAAFLTKRGVQGTYTWTQKFPSIT